MLGPLEGKQTNDDPYGRNVNCDFREYVAGLCSERARSAHAAQRTGQSAAAPALHKDEENQEDCQKRQNGCENETHDELT
jgi:hypothetical protein